MMSLRGMIVDAIDEASYVSLVVGADDKAL